MELIDEYKSLYLKVEKIKKEKRKNSNNPFLKYKNNFKPFIKFIIIFNIILFINLLINSMFLFPYLNFNDIGIGTSLLFLFIKSIPLYFFGYIASKKALSKIKGSSSHYFYISRIITFQFFLINIACLQRENDFPIMILILSMFHLFYEFLQFTSNDTKLKKSLIIENEKLAKKRESMENKLNQIGEAIKSNKKETADFLSLFKEKISEKWANDLYSKHIKDEYLQEYSEIDYIESKLKTNKTMINH